MTLMIRNIQIKDKQGINQLIEVLNKKDKLGYSITEEWFNYVIQEAEEAMFVLIYGDKLVGLATCMINQIDQSRSVVTIVVHPEYRNRGFGSKLYHEIINYSKYKRVKMLETYVKERLISGVEFATRRGFRPVIYSWQMELELDRIKFDSIEDKNTIYTFRKGTIADSVAYAQIINQSFGDELDNKALEELLKDPSIQVYILEKEGRIIGTTTMQCRHNLSLGYIYDVAIVEEYRDQGLGSEMLKNCINELKANNMDKASLLVSGENKSAMALYHRLGFKEIDTDIVMQLVDKFIIWS